MRQLVYSKPGRVEWQEGPDAELIDEDAAVVEPLAVARCDLDVSMAVQGLFPGPYPVGHEMAARVVAVGAKVSRHTTGDIVIVPYQISCGNCPPCHRRMFAACSTYRAPIGASFGFGAVGGDHGGAIADLLAVPGADHLLVAAPPDVPVTTLATLSDNVLDGYRAVGPALAAQPDADVLIVASAPGAVGLYATAVAIVLAPGRVRYIDTDPGRVEVATALGAVAARHEGTWPRRFDQAAITVDATAHPDGVVSVIRSTAPYGHCTIVAFGPQPNVALPVVAMYTRGITIHTSRADSLRYLPDVLRLVTHEGLNPLTIPTTVCPWDQADEVWLQPATKLIIER